MLTLAGGPMVQVGDDVIIMSAAGRFKVIAIDGSVVTIENAEGIRKSVLEATLRVLDKSRPT